MKLSYEGLAEVPGFLGSGLFCGIKQIQKPDLALIYSTTECSAAGVFTRNQVAASSVIITRTKLLKGGRARAVIVNSGNANVCTGKAGESSSYAAIQATARSLRIDERDVLIASTGKISEPLPIKKIIRAIPKLVGQLSVSGCHLAAEGIMTTDTFPKKITVKGKIGGKIVTVGGFAKGSGMIHPNMATMLAFFGTDAVISSSLLKKILKASTDLSFNSITVDTTSTNDMAIVLANGQARNEPFKAGTREFTQFSELMQVASRELAKMIIQDGEGATKVISIEIKGAKNRSDARKVAYSIAQSPLVKTAFFGEDPNWGRIMAAIGCSGATLLEERISMSMNGIPFVKQGIGFGNKREKKVANILKERELSLIVDLSIGKESAQIWTTDLSYDYIKINASYRT
ncbi:MAG: bifunctional glutamate N-acetyltransferase/amino-acid acetyltransferase ArgJ [Nitrospirae bacterium]|nr:bifunctional glutamate N-acetyltransferase/amino-acid acetyltransferase ArgJ [Nitrospirota bacterium]MBI3594903.1 bifunctional glutamate N-acetyltransferase/amino-acid acetyltransferase ArgJ [Nitrospirota bacterium]